MIWGDKKISVGGVNWHFWQEHDYLGKVTDVWSLFVGKDDLYPLFMENNGL